MCACLPVIIKAGNNGRNFNKKRKDMMAETKKKKPKAEQDTTSKQAQKPVQPQVTLHTQYIKDLSFESPSSPDVFLKQAGQPNVDISVNVRTTPLENNHFEVILKLVAAAKNDEQTIFIVDLSYAGIASSNVTDENVLHPLVSIEGPRLLFPFARAIIANLTREGGFMPLNLSPIDFLSLYQQNMQHRQQAAEETKADQDKQDIKK